MDNNGKTFNVVGLNGFMFSLLIDNSEKVLDETIFYYIRKYDNEYCENNNISRYEFVKDKHYNDAELTKKKDKLTYDINIIVTLHGEILHQDIINHCCLALEHNDNMYIILSSDY